MANITVTYSFSNGTAADAGEVNTNFTDLINGTSDGTKDFSINALTCAGSTTLNGAVTLGNATTDDLTFTGLCASNFVPKTNAAYDLGTSTLNWQSIYLDNDSTDGGAIYFDAGTTEFIKASADGTELDIGGFTYLDTNGAMIKTTTAYHEAKSADYTITDTDGVSVVLVTTSTTDRTVTLPTAADNSGRIITIKKVDSGDAIVTVDGEGAETIDGYTTYILHGIYDFVKLICDGTSWHIVGCPMVRYRVKTVGTSYTSSTADVLTFSNLVVGRLYKITLRSTRMFRTAADGTAVMNVDHNSVNLFGSFGVGLVDSGSYTEAVEGMSGFEASVLFAATATTLGVDVTLANGQIIGVTATLEERNDMISATYFD